MHIVQHEDGLHDVVLDRYIKKSLNHCYGMPFMQRSFMDEMRKITIAKYKLKAQMANEFIYRLDARSIRYGKRMSINENSKEE